MKIDVLVAEIGSTTTMVNAFDGIFSGNPVFLGQGQAPTTVVEGDVNIGLRRAVKNLRENLRAATLDWSEMFATCSAAGGLRMSVHGLVYDMTVRAGREAALGAGGVIKYVTAGKMGGTNIEHVKKLHPNIILLAGGVDYGERETALYNYKLLAEACPDIPVIYAGNVELQEEISLLAKKYHCKVYLTENVYPRIDDLNVEPTRKIIQKAFEENIMRSPGMEEIRRLVNGPIIPTPGAVMESARLLYGEIGDLMVCDVGGATTDLHSVTAGSEEIARLMVSPEPFAKRTVEGDLGVYINRENIARCIGEDDLRKEFPHAPELLRNLPPIPAKPEDIAFAERLTQEACHVALERHAGRLTDLYGPTGKKTVATGKDLTAVRYIIGTGGALTRLPRGAAILAGLRAARQGTRLYPTEHAGILIDRHYILASLGVLSLRYPGPAKALAKQSLAISDEGRSDAGDGHG